MPSMEISFTQTYVREVFDYLPDGSFARKIATSRSTRAGQTVAGTLLDNGYRRMTLNGRRVLAHRMVWFWHHGTWPQRIDHINGNPSDNRIENLRECTHAQNMWNAKARAGMTGVKGVLWVENKRKYRVRLRVNGKRLSFGYFHSLDEAREAITAAREHYHKDFANHGT
jgi:hypothetical protein